MKSVHRRDLDHGTKAIRSFLPPPRTKSPERPPCLMAVMRCASSPIPEFFSGMGSDLSNVDPGP